METGEEINNNVPLKKKLDLYLVRISPPCRIVWLYLLQTGKRVINGNIFGIPLFFTDFIWNDIPHTLNDVDLSGPTSDLPTALKSSPHLEVPLLIDGEMRLFEAPVILDYLAHTYNTHQYQLGTSTPTQCQITSLISWANSELHRCVGYQYVYPQFLEQYSLPDPSSNESLIEAGLRTVTSHLEKLETRYLKQHPYLCGQRVTLADMFVATVLLQLEWTNFNFGLWPKVKAWLHKVRHVDFWDTVHEFHQDFLREINQKRFQFD